MPKANKLPKKSQEPKPVSAPLVQVPAPAPAPALPAMKVVYDTVEITENSVTSKHGPLTVEDVKTVLWWETEKEYQQRIVKEKPDSKPEHWLFGEVGSRRHDNGQFQPVHCVNTKGEKVVCWNNANNRPLDLSWCEDIANMILTGTWAGPFTCPGETVNGETVRVSRYGRVLSGQHQGTGLILADEKLQATREKYGREEADKMYPTWAKEDHCFIETIVITGLSEDERILRTIDYVKPRTEADMLYTMQLFRNNTPVERKDMTRMLSSARSMLWARTDTKGYETHPEVVGFLERHKRLLKCVEHIFVENSASAGRRISKLRVSPGCAAALLYLMGCSSQKTTEYSDEYRNESPPSEKNLDWSYMDRAEEFWVCLAQTREFLPVRTALGQLVDSSVDNKSNQGLGGRMGEKLAILAKAWERFKDHPRSGGPPFDKEDLAPDGLLYLTYTSVDSDGDPLPSGRIDLVDVADFYGIDCPKRAVKDPFRGQPEPPPPTREEIERATEEAIKRRMNNH